MKYMVAITIVLGRIMCSIYFYLPFSCALPNPVSLSFLVHTIHPKLDFWRFEIKLEFSAKFQNVEGLYFNTKIFIDIIKPSNATNTNYKKYNQNA